MIDTFVVKHVDLMDDQVLAGLASTFEVSTQALNVPLNELGTSAEFGSGGSTSTQGAKYSLTDS